MNRAKPQDWYRTHRMGDDVTLIDEPHIKPFYRCNVWHVRGRDRDMLVDSGMGVVSLREWVPLVTERALTAVASHTHFDHIGCHHEFEDCAVHRAEADILANPTRAATLADPYVTRLLDDGDILDLGDRHFQVIHTPGHSPGGIALWEAATGILFSGDIVYDGPLIEDTYHANAADYHASMVRLYDLPVRIVHGGHFGSYGAERHKTLIRDWLKAHS